MRHAAVKNLNQDNGRIGIKVDIPLEQISSFRLNHPVEIPQPVSTDTLSLSDCENGRCSTSQISASEGVAYGLTCRSLPRSRARCVRALSRQITHVITLGCWVSLCWKLCKGNNRVPIFRKHQVAFDHPVHLRSVYLQYLPSAACVQRRHSIST